MTARPRQGVVGLAALDVRRRPDHKSELTSQLLMGEVVRILADNPEVRIANPKHLLYYATEAAELDEPGARAALIDLKLSQNTPFQDRPGACKLIETAAGRGDQTMTQRLADCRAS